MAKQINKRQSAVKARLPSLRIVGGLLFWGKV